MAQLILARHGESQFNAKSLWTGQWDVPLTKQGRHEATLIAAAIKDMKPSVAYTSCLSRAQDTLTIILEHNKWSRIPVHADSALNERDYGDLTGMNKWVVEERYGRTQFEKWRRGWDEPVPDGETLKAVYRRVIPYYEKTIQPNLAHDKTVLIVAHGNSLRALMKYLDGLSPTQVASLEMPFGEVITYASDASGHCSSKKSIKLKIIPPPA